MHFKTQRTLRGYMGDHAGSSPASDTKIFKTKVVGINLRPCFFWGWISGTY